MKAQPNSSTALTSVALDMNFSWLLCADCRHESRSASRAKKHVQSAFTLVELLIVVAIITILTAVGLLSFGLIGQDRYNASVNTISTQLEFAQSYAQSNGTYTWVGVQNDSAGGVDFAAWQSLDGTSTFTPANLSALVAPKVYGSAILNTSYVNSDPTIINISNSSIAQATPLQATIRGTVVSFPNVIQFSPTGGAAIYANSTVNWVEFPFNRAAGTTALSPSLITSLRVSGLTGRLVTVKP